MSSNNVDAKEDDTKSTAAVPYGIPFPMRRKGFIRPSQAQTLRKKWQGNNQWDIYTEGRDLPSSFKYVNIHTHKLATFSILRYLHSPMYYFITT